MKQLNYVNYSENSTEKNIYLALCLQHPFKNVEKNLLVFNRKKRKKLR